MFFYFPAVITITVSGYGSGAENITELTLSHEASGLVGQYKDIIRDQDSRIQKLQEQMKNVEIENMQLKVNKRSTSAIFCPLENNLSKSSQQVQLEQAQNTKAQLSDQNILLKAQLQAASDMQKSLQQSPFHLLPTQGENLNHQVQVLEGQLATLSEQQQEQQSRASYFEAENRRLLSEIEKLRQRITEAEKSAEDSKSDLEKLQKDQEDLMELLTDQETKMRSYRQSLKKLGQKVEDDSEEDDPEGDGDENVSLQ